MNGSNGFKGFKDQKKKGMGISPESYLMRNTVHGTGSFFEQRMMKIGKKYQGTEKYKQIPH